MDILEKLPLDLQLEVINYKEKFNNSLTNILSEEVMKKWWKYCNCIDCKSKRARFNHFVEGYFESF